MSKVPEQSVFSRARARAPLGSQIPTHTGTEQVGEILLQQLRRVPLLDGVFGPRVFVRQVTRAYRGLLSLSAAHLDFEHSCQKERQ